MNRPDLFVYIALSAAWVLIALWAYRIGRKANRLEAAMQVAVDPQSRSSDGI